MNFFRDEKGAAESVGDWMEDPFFYHWPLREAQKIAYQVFRIPKEFATKSAGA
jgi:hypothetical protein